MKKLTDSYTLANGVNIPCVGFGTWQAPNGEVAVKAVTAALRAGYRHIDTAAIYKNEESVGQALVESGIAREEIFLTTKVWGDDRGYEQTKAAFATSCQKLQTDYLDLYLIHWPRPKAFRDLGTAVKLTAETWRAMEDLYKEGKIRAIGVSNFMVHHFEELEKTANVTPIVNQIRLYPGFVCEDTVRYCRNYNILLEAYSPFGTGKIFESEEINKLATKYGKTIAQICLRWSLQMDFLPLPKSVTEERIIENANIFDFSLSDTDMETLTQMHNICGEGSHPDKTSF